MLPFFFRRRSKPRQSAAAMGRAIVDAMLPEYRDGFDQDYANLIKNLNEDPNWSSAEFALEAMIYILHCLDICVFKRYGPEYRAAFMDAAVSRLCEAYLASELWMSDEDYRNWFAERYTQGIFTTPNLTCLRRTSLSSERCFGSTVSMFATATASLIL
jgi:hypothetical protein